MVIKDQLATLPSSMRQLSSTTSVIDIVAMVASLKADEFQQAMNQNSGSALDKFEFIGEFAVIASNLATEIQNKLPNGLPGVWAYEVMQPFGEFVIDQIANDNLSETVILNKLGSLAYNMFDHFPDDWQIVAPLIFQVTYYTPSGS